MGARLLIAEDTRDLNRALTAVLEHEGYEVTSTFDGEEALSHIEQESYDGIVLDIMMPKKDGLAVLQTLRADGVLTPVLLLTAKAEVDDRVAGLDAGADDYLPKPFAMQELLARVRSMTRRRTDYDTRNLSFEDLALDAGSFELRATNVVRLSVKEFELMQTLMLNRGRHLSCDYLLGNVWAGEEARQDTVALYVSYLCGKLKWVGSNVTIEGTPADGYHLVTRGEQP